MYARWTPKRLLVPLALLAAVVFLAAEAYANCGSCGTHKKAEGEQKMTEGICPAGTCPVAGKPQTRCPVMGGPINKAQFVDVKGYRIYACCPGCLPKIKADPEAALETLRARGEAPLRLAALEAKKPEHAEHKHKERAVSANINTDVLAILVRANVPLTILDARGGGEIDRRIPGAHVVKTDAGKEEIARLVPDKNALIVTYCGGITCPLSNQLGKRLRELGYKNVLEYPAGLAGWAEADLPVEAVEHAVAE
jgi:rhodanese-related sulfurtransferase